MWDCSICIRGNTMEGMYHSNDFYNNKKEPLSAIYFKVLFMYICTDVCFGY